MSEAKQEAVDKKLEKLEKAMSDTEVSEIKVADSKKLKDMVYQLSQKIEEIETEKSADKNLNAAKEVMKDLNGGYNDLLKPKKNMLKYVLLTLQSKGQV
jgi:hypothetical protein